MTVAVECPHCYWSATAPDKFAGRRVRCRHCGKPIEVDAGQTEYAEYVPQRRKRPKSRRKKASTATLNLRRYAIGGFVVAIVLVAGWIGISLVSQIDIEGTIAAVSASQTVKESSLAPNQEALKASIRENAERMQNAIVSGDLDTFVAYTYPKIVSLMGGAAQMKAKVSENLSETMDPLQQITMGELSDVLVDGERFVAFIPIESVYEFPNTRVVQKNYRIACSTDEGQSWTFLDGQGKRAQEDFYRKEFPVLTSQIPFPKCDQRRL